MSRHLDSKTSSHSSKHANEHSSSLDYHHPKSDSRKHYTSREERLAGFQKFVRRYESQFLFYTTTFCED
jgi:hypothetical protein